tara:strand:- start:231 stop:545 length:315 start_codon:yes stop_codon:yes gene_type:complete
MRSEPMSAVQNPETEKPSRKDAANQNNKPFITNANSPSVSNVIGSVNTKRTGRTTAFKMPSTIAAMMAMYTPSTAIPGTKYAITSKVSADNKIRKIIFISSYSI